MPNMNGSPRDAGAENDELLDARPERAPQRSVENPRARLVEDERTGKATLDVASREQSQSGEKAETPAPPGDEVVREVVRIPVARVALERAERTAECRAFRGRASVAARVHFRRRGYSHRPEISVDTASAHATSAERVS
jgi:hypothetical protein